MSLPRTTEEQWERADEHIAAALTLHRLRDLPRAVTVAVSRARVCLGWTTDDDRALLHLRRLTPYASDATEDGDPA